MMNLIILTCALFAQTHPGSHAAAPCELTIDGGGIQKLVLEKRDGAVLDFVKPPATLQLPAGSYRVHEITLAGGFISSGEAAANDGWFTLTPGEPYQLRAGAPLRLKAKVEGGGMEMRVSCDLVDAAGRTYGRPRMVPLPQVRISKDGREVHSGKFEFG